MSGLILGMILGTMLTLVIVVIASCSREQRSIRYSTQKPRMLKFPLKNQKAPRLELRQKLIEMVGGDLETAEKLVARARFATHGKSEAYYW
jgi:hypothetical protein